MFVASYLFPEHSPYFRPNDLRHMYFYFIFHISRILLTGEPADEQINLNLCRNWGQSSIQRLSIFLDDIPFC